MPLLRCRTTCGVAEGARLAPLDGTIMVADRFTGHDPTTAFGVERSGADLGSIRKEAARLQKIEADHLALLRRPSAKGRVRIWTLTEFAENPMDHLQTLLEDINPRSARRLTEVPRMIDLAGFAEFLATLRNQGMQPILTGDFTGLPRPAESLPQRSRPHLVK